MPTRDLRLTEPSDDFSPWADPADLVEVTTWLREKRLIDRRHLDQPVLSLRTYRPDGQPDFDWYQLESDDGWTNQSCEIQREGIVTVAGVPYRDFPKFRLIFDDTRWLHEDEMYREKVYRIVACRDFGDVRAGDLGGYVAYRGALSHHGLCWIYPGAVVAGDGCVMGDVLVRGDVVIETRISDPTPILIVDNRDAVTLDDDEPESTAPRMAA